MYSAPCLNCAAKCSVDEQNCAECGWTLLPSPAGTENLKSDLPKEGVSQRHGKAWLVVLFLTLLIPDIVYGVNYIGLLSSMNGIIDTDPRNNAQLAQRRALDGRHSDNLKPFLDACGFNSP